MAQKPRVARAAGLTTLRSVGRLTIRRTRAALRGKARHRWWTVALDSPTGLRLRPAVPADAVGWLDLVDGAGARPERVGIAASPLGGGADSRLQWIERYLDLRAEARRGQAYIYLVERDGGLVGEALGLVDLGTSTVQLLVWLRPDTCTAGQVATVVDLLGRHVLTGPHGTLRARCTVPEEAVELLAALSELGYAVEGTLADPPRGDRTALVATRAVALRDPADVAP